MKKAIFASPLSAALGTALILAVGAQAAAPINHNVRKSERMQRAVKPFMVVRPQVTADGDVMYGRAVKGRPSFAPSKNNPANNTGRSTTLASVGGPVRVSKGVAVAGYFVNPRGAMTAYSAQGEKATAITQDGNYVVFQSCSSGLVPNDTNGTEDIFRLKLSDMTVQRASTDSSGNQGAAAYAGDFNGSHCPAGSSDGGFIAFYSDQNLAAADTDVLTDVYLKNMSTGAATVLTESATNSVASLSNPDADLSSAYSYFINTWGLDISNDGQRVAFLFPDINISNSINAGQVFPNGWVWDVATGNRYRFTSHPEDQAGITGSIFDMRMSGDGSRVAIGASTGLANTGGTNLVGFASGRQAFGWNLGAGSVPSNPYVLNRPAGTTPSPIVPPAYTAGNTRQGTTPGELYFNDGATLASFLTGGFTATRELRVKGMTGGDNGNTVVLSLPGGDPTGDGTDTSIAGPNLPRFTRQPWINHTGNKVYFSTHRDVAGLSYPDDLADQSGGYAEGTSYERYGVFSVNYPLPAGTPVLVSNSTVPATFTFEYKPSTNSGDTKLVFLNADEGASGVVPGQSRMNYDVFLRDLGTGTRTRLLAQPTTNGLTMDHSEGSNISADGRWIVYTTMADNIEAGDNNSVADVALYDSLTDTSKIVSKRTGGTPAVWASNSVNLTRLYLNGVDLEPGFVPAAERSGISGDGNLVAFTQIADDDETNNLTADAIDVSISGARQVYVYNNTANTVTLVSKDSGGTILDASNFEADMSDDGAMVCFISTATNIGLTNSAGDQQVVVKNLGTGALSVCSPSSVTPGSAGSGNCFGARIGGTAGTYRVAFNSAAMDLSAATTAINDTFDDGSGVTSDIEAFLWDSTSPTTATFISGKQTDGSPYRASGWTGTAGPRYIATDVSISRNGSFVAFSHNGPLTSGDPTPADPNCTSCAYPTSLFRYTVAGGFSSLVQVNTNSANTEINDFVDDGSTGQNDLGTNREAAVSDDGNIVVFWTEQPLDPADTNQSYDLYMKNVTSGAVARLVFETLGSVQQATNLHGRFEFDEDGAFTKPYHIDSPSLAGPDGSGFYTVAFNSDNPNLSVDDTNGHYDIFTVTFSPAGNIPPTAGTGGGATPTPTPGGPTPTPGGPTATPTATPAPTTGANGGWVEYP